MKNLFAILAFVFLVCGRISSQTPFDNFAPEQSVKEILQLPESHFQLVNNDLSDSVRYASFDENNLTMSFYSKRNTLIRTVKIKPIESKFLTVDRFAEKYPWQSPYCYASNNPMRFVDVNGDSSAVLNMGSGADQHMAILIQNKNNEWQYFSLNGVTVFNATNGVFGGGPSDDVGKMKFDSPEAFLQSAYNTRAENSDDKRAKGRMNGYGFTEAYVLPTSDTQDNIIRNTFLNAVNEGYSLLDNQCSQAVQKSLNAAGVETRLSEINAYSVAKVGIPIETKYNPYLPSNAFKAIIQNNSNGYYIKKR